MGGFDEEATGDGGVGLEGDVEGAEGGEEFVFDVAIEEGVGALVDSGEDVAFFRGDAVDVKDLGGAEVGYAKL